MASRMRLKGRRPGEQRSVGQLFRLVFLWSVVTVGGSGLLAGAVAAALDARAYAWSIGIASAAVIVSNLITAGSAARDSLLGGVASALAYVVKILLIVGMVALALRYIPADGRALVISLVVCEIVSLVTMCVVVMWGEGPGFDIPERDMAEE
ncbi:hypothetical protein VR010_07025 [Actinomycetaceae bacterium L2_0104]